MSEKKNRQLTRRGALKVMAASAAAASIPGLSSRAFSADAVIKVWHPYSGKTHPMVKVINAFNAKKTGVAAVSNQVGTNYETMTQKAMVGIASHRPPEVMCTGWKFGYMARRTMMAKDLSKIPGPATKEMIAQFNPSLLPLVTIDGALVGAPWAMSTPMLFLNTELWKKGGLDPEKHPTDIDQVYETSRVLQKKLGMQGLLWRVNEWTAQAFIQSAGGFVLDADGRPVMDSPEAIHGMEKFAQPHKMGIWKPAAPKEVRTAFRSGNCPTLGGDSSASYFGHAKASKFEVKMCMHPGIDGHPAKPPSGGNFLAVYTDDVEKQKACVEFLKFCGSKEGMSIWLETGYMNTTAHKLPIPKGQEAAYQQLANGLTAESIWPGKRGLEGQKIFRTWVSRVVTLEMSPKEAMKKCKEEIAPVLAS